MLKDKKKLFGIIAILLVIISICAIVIFKYNNDPYTYKWVKMDNSIINQQRLYVVSRNGKHVNGNVEITYLNNKNEKIKISNKGKLYVRSIIKKVKIIK